MEIPARLRFLSLSCVQALQARRSNGLICMDTDAVVSVLMRRRCARARQVMYYGFALVYVV